MGDAVLSASKERAPAEGGEVQAEEGQELHGKNEEKAQGMAEEEQGMTEEEQGKSGEDIEEHKNGGDAVGEEDEEPAECGFCLFMKSGPCRESFISWEQCIEQAEKDKEDMVEKCHKVTFMLKECMEHNSDYYEPVLQAEKAMGEAALEEEEAAAAAAQGGANAGSSDSQVHLQSENSLSSDAPPSQAPARVDTEEHQHTHAASEEHPARASSGAPAEALHSSDLYEATREHPST